MQKISQSFFSPFRPSPFLLIVVSLCESRGKTFFELATPKARVENNSHFRCATNKLFFLFLIKTDAFVRKELSSRILCLHTILRGFPVCSLFPLLLYLCLSLSLCVCLTLSFLCTPSVLILSTYKLALTATLVFVCVCKLVIR